MDRKISKIPSYPEEQIPVMVWKLYPQEQKKTAITAFKMA
jgi:hypothetical protein